MTDIDNTKPEDYQHDQEPDYDEYAYEISDCCGAEIIHTDICSDCLEHCDVHEWDKDDETPEQLNARLLSMGF